MMAALAVAGSVPLRFEAVFDQGPSPGGPNAGTSEMEETQ